ncbi:MAG TPA: hypothetical protein QF520_13085 [SAR202 cluster bacterium]|jgi:hypothetical protein|nr:hypothetical protein [SAR202 cluster bacterium]|tara:strand:+ start:1491 stop:1670 length:180 start_codon:yes stop_codon:yes gene_type:complete
MKKEFDCVEMMHRGAGELRKEIGDLSRDEQLKFWAARTQALRVSQQQVRETKSTDADST